MYKQSKIFDTKYIIIGFSFLASNVAPLILFLLVYKFLPPNGEIIKKAR